MKNIPIVVLFVSLVLSCSTRIIQKEKDPVEEQERKSYDHWSDYANQMFENLENVEFYSKKPEGQLRYAKHAASEGDYDLAIAVFSKLYKDESNGVAIRSEALFRLGKIYSSLLYTQRDFDKATYLFEQLIFEFRNSLFRPEAEEAIKNIQKLSPRR